MKKLEIKTIFVDDVDWNNLEKDFPQKGTKKSAGYDIRAISDPTIVGDGDESFDMWNRVDYIQYRSGIKIDPSFSDKTFHTLVFPRSSVSKYNLILANSVGLIDNDYRGEILLRFKYIWQPEDLMFDSDVRKMFGVINEDKIYKVGDRICQLVGMDDFELNFQSVNQFESTERGEGGFQSTGH